MDNVSQNVTLDGLSICIDIDFGWINLKVHHSTLQHKILKYEHEMQVLYTNCDSH